MTALDFFARWRVRIGYVLAVVVLWLSRPVPRSIAASLAAAIGFRQMAIVLDNFEHLMGATPLAAAVLADCPELVMLVTSRESLHLRGEREMVVQPLAVGADYGLVVLHGARSGAERLADFILAPQGQHILALRGFETAAAR